MGIPVENRIISQAGQARELGANWWPAIWFAGLFLVSYAAVLVKLGKLWVTDADMNHGTFVPVLVAYIVWERRHALAAVKPVHNLLGLGLMVLGAALLCVGPPSLDTYASVTRVAFLFSLVGAILYLRGLATVRMLLYPLILLLLMFPMPGFIMGRITFPLQVIASKVAEHMLDLLGYSVLREGNLLMLPGQTLNIAEACSGLRSLIALTFLGQAYIYLFDSRPWMRVIMALLVIPIAVLANSIRIVSSAVAGSYNREWGQGAFHESTGWIVFVVAFLCILCAHLVTNRIGGKVKST